MKYIVDRFEGKYAVCEDVNKEIIDIKLNILPNEIKEGDVVVFNKGVYSIDVDETKARKDRVGKLMNDIWE